jgi:hypothetical protein
MQNRNDSTRTFLNRRNWGSFASGLSGGATYPNVTEAVKSGRAWFTESVSQASNWLAQSTSFADKFKVG